jgi:hypothetical protein
MLKCVKALNVLTQKAQQVIPFATIRQLNKQMKDLKQFFT